MILTPNVKITETQDKEFAIKLYLKSSKERTSDYKSYEYWLEFKFILTKNLYVHDASWKRIITSQIEKISDENKKQKEGAQNTLHGFLNYFLQDHLTIFNTLNKTKLSQSLEPITKKITNKKSVQELFNLYENVLKPEITYFSISSIQEINSNHKRITTWDDLFKTISEHYTNSKLTLDDKSSTYKEHLIKINNIIIRIGLSSDTWNFKPNKIEIINTVSKKEKKIMIDFSKHINMKKIYTEIDEQLLS